MNYSFEQQKIYLEFQEAQMKNSYDCLDYLPDKAGRLAINKMIVLESVKANSKS